MIGLKKTLLSLIAIIALLAHAASASAAECRAVIISGDAGPDVHMADLFQSWTTRWSTLLKDKYNFKPENIVVLHDPPLATQPASAPPAPPPSSAHDKVLAALSDLVRLSKPEDQILLVLIGHGYDNQGQSKFALPGRHLADVEVARALQPLAAKNLIVINTASSSTLWAKTLAGKGRIIITADNDEAMRGQTYFCEFLLRSLQPGNVNLCDAFNAASRNTIMWYQNQFLDGDTTTVHGAEFQEIWKAVYPGKDMRAGDPQPRTAVNDKNQQDAWDGRRVITEVAGLEDNGDGAPAGIFDDGQTFTPLPNKEGEGRLAHTITLGKP